MDFGEFTKLSVHEMLLKVQSSPSGLTTHEALERLQKYGPNQVLSQKNTAVVILLRQFKSPFFYLLLAAAILTFLLGERFDPLLILIFIAINVTLGFLQEYRSEQAVKLLRKFITHKEKVIRDGKEQLIDTTTLVPGDVLILSPGDIVPADIRILETDNLTVDEEVLTGESIHIQKSSQEMKNGTKEIYKASNILFEGSTILSGKCRCVVFATGANTQFGNIAKLTTETVRVSTFEKELTKFSKYILRLVVVTLVILMIINVAIKKQKQSLTELALFSVALAVSVIPEALPVVTTFSLSQGSLRLARKKVVVKRLASIEDLGAVEVLCTDKTGTLTQNNLEVKDFYSSNKDKLILFGNLASEENRTDSFDSALWEGFKEKDQLQTYKSLYLQPFDPFRKRTTALVKKDKQYYLISRGAPEEIFKLSKENFFQDKKVQGWIKEKGLSGQRILAVSYKPVKSSRVDDIKSNEKNMRFLGLIAFSDPLKPTTLSAVEQAKKFGVQIKILTGDSIEVAAAVAKEVGIIDDVSKAILGEDFEKLPADEQYKVAQNVHVFARVTPEQKYRIIKLLQEKYEVGFLGEGINDSPALKIANVALVVESASDISREAADIILLEKDLQVIVDGIKEGRKVYANNKKYITATLSANFGNFYAIALSSLLITFLPMLPLQILLVNLLSDFPMISIATDTVDEDDISTPKKYSIKTLMTKALFLGVVSTFFDFVFFGTFYKISPSVLQTSWFIGSILTELVFLFSVRTNKLFFKAILPSNLILVLTIVAGSLTIIIPYTSFGANVFEFTQLPLKYLLSIFAIVGTYFVSTEIAKLMFVKFAKAKPAQF